MLSAVVLAAGDSVRMKSVKPLLLWKGLPFIEHVCSSLRIAGIEERVVVLGRRHADILKKWQPQGEKIAVNHNPDDGQLSSLRTGLSLLRCTGGISSSCGLLICLADQPLIKPETFAAVRKCWEKHKDCIVIPRVPRPGRKPGEPPFKRGHPIILPAEAVPLCDEGPLDKGLHWVTHHPSVKIFDLDVDDSAVIRDFDTPEAYAALLEEEKFT